MNGIGRLRNRTGATPGNRRLEAIAAGLGPDARAARTDEVSDADLAAADLVVIGAPVIALDRLGIASGGLGG